MASPELVNPLCDVAELILECKLKTSDVTAGSDLEADLYGAVNDASRFVEEYLKRDFQLHDHLTTALQIDQTYGDCVFEALWLPFYPIISLTEVKAGDTVLTLNTDYVVANAERGKLVRLSSNWNPRRPGGVISVKGKFGYERASSDDVPTLLPPGIRIAAKLIAAAFSGHNRKEVLGLGGDKQEVIDRNIPKAAFQMLDRRPAPLIL